MPSYQDTSDESRWQSLNKSLRQVSSTMDGKYDAVQAIEVFMEKIIFIDQFHSRSFLCIASLSLTIITSLANAKCYALVFT